MVIKAKDHSMRCFLKQKIFTKAEFLLLLALGSVNFVNIIDFMIMMPLGPQLMRTFKVSPHEFGLLVSAYTFAAALSSVVGSFLIDRFDRKTALLFFFCGFCVGTVACGFSSSYVALLTARFLTGVFGGILGTLVLSIVGDTIDITRRGSAMGIVMAAFSAASVLGVPLSVFLANYFSWHAPFYFLGALTLLLILILNSFLPSLTSHLAHYRNRNPKEVICSVVKDSNQLEALSFTFLLVFGQFSMIPFLSPSLVTNAGLTEAQLPLIYLIGGGVSIFTSPWIGRIADRIGKKKTFIIFALLSLIPTLIITHLGKTPVVLVLLVIAFFFAVVGGRMIPAMAMITSTVPPERRGGFMSLVTSTQHMSSSLGSYIAGLIVVKEADGSPLFQERCRMS